MSTKSSESFGKSCFLEEVSHISVISDFWDGELEPERLSLFGKEEGLDPETDQMHSLISYCISSLAPAVHDVTTSALRLRAKEVEFTTKRAEPKLKPQG